MAEWIKLEHTTPDKPEIVQAAAILGIDPDAVLGKCIRLWIWADQQSISGDDLSVTFSFLDRLTGCPGFSNAITEAGWLDGESGHVSIPNFTRHNGKSAKQRALSRRRMEKHRLRLPRNIRATASPSPSLSSSSLLEGGSKGGGFRPTPSEIESIYQAYPRKVAKAEALRAIQKALVTISADGVSGPVAWLLERVAGFAASPAGNSGSYTPHPATWFNRGSYSDDQAEWFKVEESQKKEPYGRGRDLVG